MTYRGLAPGAWLVAACFRAVRQRLATFVKDLVRAGLVPSRLETWWCAQHAVVMQPWRNARGTWWSHQVADGTWCTGQATTTDTPARPHTTHNQRDVYKSL
jgi:hypothetical protein